MAKETTPLTWPELENFVLQHIATWVENDQEVRNKEKNTFDHHPELFRTRMDEFTNSFRNKWFVFEKEHNLKQK